MAAALYSLPAACSCSHRGRGRRLARRPLARPGAAADADDRRHLRSRRRASTSAARRHRTSAGSTTTSYLQTRRAGRRRRVAEGRRRIGPHVAAVRRGAHGDGARGAARRRRATKRRGSARSADLTFNPSRTGALVTIDDDLYFYDFAAGRAARLTSAAGAEEEATFSPDGRIVAFVRGNNLYVVDVARPARARADDRRQRRDPQRQARLAVPGRDLRPRPLPRLLVEPRLDAPRVPSARRAPGARVHGRR